MALTKKQKNFIRNNLGGKTEEEMSKHLGVPLDDIKTYRRSLAGESGIRPEKRTSFPGDAFWTNRYFHPLALLIFTAIVAIICYDSKLYISGDNVEFMDLGTWIREGKGMGGTTKYTPLFPFLLAVVQFLSDNGLQAQKFLIVLFYIGCAPLLFLIFERYMSRGWSAVATATIMMNAFLIEFGHIVMSEVPYLFVSLAAIVLFERFIETRRKRDYAAAMIAVVAVYYVRPAALALFAAVVAYLLLRKEWKLALITCAILFLAVLPWSIRNQLIAGGSDYSKALFLRNPYNPELGSLSIPEFFSRILYNTRLYLSQEIPYILFPFRFRTTMVHPEPFPQAFGYLLSLAAIGGFIWHFIRSRSLLSLYVFFYMGIILMWYEGWSGSRFIIPLMPFFIFFLMALIYGAMQKLRSTQFAFAGSVAAAVAAALLLCVNAQNVYSWDSYMGKYPPAWENYFKAAEWVRDNTPEESIFCDRKAGLFKIIARRTGTGSPGSSFGNDPLRHLQFFYERNVDYVIIPSIPYQDIGLYLLPAVQAYTDRFKVVHFIDNPPTYVLKLDRTVPLPGE